MAGDGLYNEHSQPQHVAGDDGLPLLERAVEAISLDRERGVVVADFGSSQGRNSLVPMSVVIEKLRGRLDADAPISIVHTDLPSNDFAALFTTLETDPHSYLNGAANVFAYVTGRSFYERLFQAEHVALGWSSIAVHWLSSVPAPLREHIFSPLSSAPERAAYAASAAADWERFLEHRLAELEHDGQLVIVGSGADENGRSGAEGLMDLANDALLQMVAENTLSRDEYEQMVVPTYYRTLREFIEPLGKLATAAGSFELEECSQADLADPLWASYQQSGDLAEYAAGVADFLRAFSEPSLFSAIAAERSPQAAATLADEFYGRVREAVARQPAKAECTWRLVLLRLAKRR
jgi:SAM dependent carboxyl methyltransferase